MGSGARDCEFALLIKLALPATVNSCRVSFDALYWSTGTRLLTVISVNASGSASLPVDRARKGKVVSTQYWSRLLVA